jgi:hypothetical protein
LWFVDDRHRCRSILWRSAVRPHLILEYVELTLEYCVIGFTCLASWVMSCLRFEVIVIVTYGQCPMMQPLAGVTQSNWQLSMSHSNRHTHTKYSCAAGGVEATVCHNPRRESYDLYFLEVNGWGQSASSGLHYKSVHAIQRNRQ